MNPNRIESARSVAGLVGCALCVLSASTGGAQPAPDGARFRISLERPGVPLQIDERRAWTEVRVRLPGQHLHGTWRSCGGGQVDVTARAAGGEPLREIALHLTLLIGRRTPFVIARRGRCDQGAVTLRVRDAEWSLSTGSIRVRAWDPRPGGIIAGTFDVRSDAQRARARGSFHLRVPR